MGRTSLLFISLLSLALLGAGGKREAFDKAFSPLAKKLASHVASLHVGGERVGYITLIRGKWGVTCASLVPLSKRRDVEVYWQGKKLAFQLRGRDPQNDLQLFYFPQLPGKVGFSIGKGTPPIEGTVVLSLSAEGKLLAGGIVSAFRDEVRPKRKKVFSVYGFLGFSGTGLRRSYRDVVQHDSPVEKRDLGSPLIDRQGRLVGVNVAYVYRGTGLAVSHAYLAKVLPKLQKVSQPQREKPPLVPPKKPARPSKVPVVRPFLGVVIQDSPQGIRVVRVARNGPAARAGIQPGDVILRWNGTPLSRVSQLLSQMRRHRPGDKVQLLIRRSGQKKTFQVLLGAR